jgi:hypothetical protein
MTGAFQWPTGMKDALVSALFLTMIRQARLGSVLTAVGAAEPSLGMA